MFPFRLINPPQPTKQFIYSSTLITKTQVSDFPTQYLHIPSKPLRKRNIASTLITTNMSEEWESVTKIGSKVRSGGAAPKEKVLRGDSAINAARRSGAAVSTEKKFGGSNTKAAAEGQHLTKVDRSDDIVKPKTVGSAIGDAVKKARGDAKNDKGTPMTQKDLATKINQTPTIVADFERGTAPPNEKILSDMERVLKVHLRGKNIGEPKVFGKKKAQSG